MANFGVYIQGKRGSIGRDLAELATNSDIELCDDPQDAEFVALCVPAHAAQDILDAKTHRDRVVIDFSGAAKRSRIGQYGLMLSSSEPWDPNLNCNERVFGNPGCIASAVIKGLHVSGIKDQNPREISVFAVGGSSYAHEISPSEIRLAKRLIEHPHVTEIETALGGITRVRSFMPAVSGGVERGLLVGVTGKVESIVGANKGVAELGVQDVSETAALKHRLETREAAGGYEFSLGVVIDNLRFVTQNAVDLMRYVTEKA